jgi:hypothetical protein
MLHTLADARAYVRRFVDNGTCDNDLVDARINDALERLIDDQDWECMRKFMRISVCNRAFSLPYNVEKLLWADTNGTPARIFGQAYQFLSSGPGDLDYRASSSCFQDLADKGDDWPVQFDVPKQYVLEGEPDETIYPEGMVLAAFCTEEDDVDVELNIRGFRHDATEIGVSETVRGETLVVQRWTGGTEGLIRRSPGASGFTTTENYFQDVSRVIKPVTKGYITLYAVDVANDYFFLLAKYHPKQTIPQFRRYNVTNHSLNVQTNILTLVKLRHIPLIGDDDIVPLDSLQALKLMIMAIREEDSGNIEGSIAFEQKARFVMGNRETARTMTDGTPAMINIDYRTSLGRYQNRRISI